MYQSLFFVEFIALFLLSNLLTKSLLGILFKLTKSKRITVGLLFCLFFPGIVVHELAHLLAAGLLFVKTGRLEIVPRIMDDGIQLGRVEVAKTDPFRRAIIGVAPVLLGMAMIFGILFYLQPLAQKNVGIYIFLLYIIFAIGNTLFSSKKDLEGTVEFLLTSLLIFLALFILKTEFAKILLQILQTKEAIVFFKNADWFLIVPIILDLIIVALVGFLTGEKSTYSS